MLQSVRESSAAVLKYLPSQKLPQAVLSKMLTQLYTRQNVTGEIGLRNIRIN